MTGVPSDPGRRNPRRGAPDVSRGRGRRYGEVACLTGNHGGVLHVDHGEEDINAHGAGVSSSTSLHHRRQDDERAGVYRHHDQDQNGKHQSDGDEYAAQQPGVVESDSWPRISSMTRDYPAVTVATRRR